MSAPRRGARRALLLPAFVLGALACAGDGEEDTTFRSGLDANRSLAQLSASEAMRLCDDTRAWASRVYAFERLQEPVCRRRAVTGAVLTPTTTDAALEAGCQSAYGDCLKLKPPEASVLPTDPCPLATTSCPATVGQVVVCVNDLQAAFRAALAAVKRCEDLTTTSATAVPQRSVQTPASCQALRKVCPDLELPWPPEVVWTTPSPSP